jgi:hypothetical protein
VWYPFPTTLRFFIANPDAASFLTAASAELWSPKIATIESVVPILFSNRTLPETSCAKGANELAGLPSFQEREKHPQVAAAAITFA